MNKNNNIISSKKNHKLSAPFISKKIKYIPESICDYVAESVDHILKKRLEIDRGLQNKDVKAADPVTASQVFIESLIRKIYKDIEEQNIVLGREIVDKEFDKITKNHIKKNFKIINYSENKFDYVFDDFEFYDQYSFRSTKVIIGALPSNDYESFLDFVNRNMEQSKGVLAIVTNNSFIYDTKFNLIRKKYIHSFDEIYVCNLIGELFGSKALQGEDNESKQGVSVVFFIKTNLNKNKFAQVKYLDVVNSEEIKFKILNKNAFQKSQWERIHPRQPYWYLQYEDTTYEEEFIGYWDVTDLMPVYNRNPSSFKTGVNLDLMLTKTKGLFDLNAYTCRANDLKRDYLERHLDYWEYFFPLYYHFVDSNSKTTRETLEGLTRKPNLNPLFIEDLRYKLSLRFILDGAGDLITTVGPEDVFAYICAFLYSNSYKRRYDQQLEIYFPRIPLTSNKDLFVDLVKKGQKLMRLRFIDINSFTQIDSIFFKVEKWGIKVQGDKRSHLEDWEVEKIFYDKINSRVYVNSSHYFEGIEKEIWDYKLGQIQVLDAWLRRYLQTGEKLKVDDLKYFMKLAVSLRETLKTIKQIDLVLSKWPVE
ncbi:MAG: hypothetical protein GF335_01275 [Candidatus Moranbacteria bacterium]|nr:hypothetical protein [Candidatus Moranbacteria bacterium]